jgi:hypothetical protein
MKYLKLFESFKDIDSICDEYHIEDYTINSDVTVDVNGDVNLNGQIRNKNNLPLKFGTVSGHFTCSFNNLTTLKGAPTYVGGMFLCNRNELVTLEGGPKYVIGSFGCTDNQLINLNGAPIEVDGNFECYSNKLVTLEGGPKEIGGAFDCYDNPIYEVYRLFPNYKYFMESLDYNYLRGTNIDKRRLQEALDEVGMEMPESISGWEWI